MKHEGEGHSPLPPSPIRIKASRQLKLCKIFIFGMAYGITLFGADPTLITESALQFYYALDKLLSFDWLDTHLTLNGVWFVEINVGLVANSKNFHI